MCKITYLFGMLDLENNPRYKHLTLAVIAVILLNLAGCNLNAPTVKDKDITQEIAGFVEAPPIANSATMVETRLKQIQFGSVEPKLACPGSTIVVATPDGQLFPTLKPETRVLFSPCGIQGEILDHAGDQLVIEVPERASSGPIWLVDMPLEESNQRHAQINQCLANANTHAEIPSIQPVMLCNDRSFGYDSDHILGGIAIREGVDPIAQTCSLYVAPRAAGLLFKGATTIESKYFPSTPPPESICFDACPDLQALRPESTGSSAVQLQTRVDIVPTPRINWFRVKDAVRSQNGAWEAEQGPLTFEWHTDSVPGAKVTLTFPDGSVVPLGSSGKITRNVFTSGDVVLQTRGKCGTERSIVSLNLYQQFSWDAPELAIEPGQSQSITVSLPNPRPTPTKLTVSSTSPSAISVVSKQVTIPAGASKGVIKLKRSMDTRWAGNSELLARIRVAVKSNVGGVTIKPPSTSLRILSSGSYAQVKPPKSSHVRVRGTVEYRDTGATDRPIRRARFEVWRQIPFRAHELAFVGETDEKGSFDVHVIAKPGAKYDVTIVADGPAGTVDRSATLWHWAPMNKSRAASGGDTLTLDHTYTSRYDTTRFNALDAIYGGWKYAKAQLGLSETDALRILKKVRVVPTSGNSAWAMPVAASTHLWIGGGRIFRDQTTLHEYGHHLQRMNNTYHAWPSDHNGCQATLVGMCIGRVAKFNSCGVIDNEQDANCWINSPEFAWFDGFPTYFAKAVLRWDNKTDNHLSGTQALSWRPVAIPPSTPSCTCPLVNSFHTNRAGVEITGSFLEDYVAGALLALSLRRDIVSKNRKTMTPAAVEELMFRTWFNDMRNQTVDSNNFKNAFGAKLMSRTPLDNVYSDHKL